MNAICNSMNNFNKYYVRQKKSGCPFSYPLSPKKEVRENKREHKNCHLKSGSYHVLVKYSKKLYS